MGQGIRSKTECTCNQEMEGIEHTSPSCPYYKKDNDIKFGEKFIPLEKDKIVRRLLHMDADIPSIYFPIGSLESGGTCEFATKECMEYCPSGQSINEHERYALKYFKENTSEVIAQKIIEDFGHLVSVPYNAKMIQWFVWGDCPSYLTEKVAEVILKIRDKGIPQYGFTRNCNLWKLIPNEDRLHIGFSVDDLQKAKELSFGKMTAHPDFEHGYAEMIFDGEIRARCNGWWCITEFETRNSDCTCCLSHGEGCYTKQFK